ncbi:MAG: DUF1820 family protein [Pseudomonadota bacterium]
MSEIKSVYKILFLSHGQIYEVYARNVHQSNMMAFIEVEEFIFGEKAQLVVDPSEEKLKAEFEGVKRSYIPMHSILRIDEVDKEGVAKITDSKGENVAMFPVPTYPPKK